LDNYIPGSKIIEHKKRKSAHQNTFLFDHLDSRGNLPVLSLEKLDKAIPLSTSNGK